MAARCRSRFFAAETALISSVWVAVHEMGIASSVLETVRAEADRRPGARVIKVGLKVGEWAGVDAEALRFCWEVMAPEMALEIEACPRQNRCAACGCVFRVVGWSVACPDCGAPKTQPVSGDELKIAYLEIEEP